jgi:2-polyprenyl-6-methoxyphenol hydroxylase-like FAD-dependent oxidoreductase
MFEYDVIVVGAGPVGCAAAIELGRSGVKTLLVDRGNGNVLQPKMDLVSVRTMEFCRRWGIADRVRSAGYNRAHPQDCIWLTALTGHEIAREPFPAPRDEPPLAESPERKERCPQNFFDPVMAAAARSLATVDLQYETEYLAHRQYAESVSVRFADVHTKAEREIRARYLIGCDGGASAVREQLGIGTGGNEVLTYTTNVIFRCPDFYRLHDKAPGYRYIFIGEEGTWATIVAIDGRDTYRFSWVGNEQRHKPSEGELLAQIHRAMGKPFKLEVISTMPWVRREMVADAYGKGRVFLSGDAVRLNSPTGAFGMNTGIQDAVDLAWKLSAVVAGWGGPQLLASYEAERRPVAVRNVREATVNLRRMLATRSEPPPPAVFEEGPAGDRARASYGAMCRDTMRPEWETLGIHLGYRYNTSPVIISDGTPEPEDTYTTYTPTARPGHRAPHAWLADGRSTLDLFGNGLTLLRFDKSNAGDDFVQAARASGVPLEDVHIADPKIAALYGGVPLVLVRPDGFVAWRGQVGGRQEAAEVIDCVRGAANVDTDKQLEKEQA